MQKKNAIQKRGFSLVEMAVVLVIIGMLIGGVLGGQELIQASKLRSVMSDVEGYKRAIFDFDQQYSALPGDLTNATSLWASTADGDGNGIITWNTEGYRAWQHLRLAGLIPGSYEGTATGDQAVLDTNVPRSKLTHAGYSFDYADGTATYVEGQTGNVLLFGTPGASANTTGAAISAVDAYSIDSKMDDSEPDSGDVRPLAAHTTCVSGAAPSMIYATTTAGETCGLVFKF